MPHSPDIPDAISLLSLRISPTPPYLQVLNQQKLPGSEEWIEVTSFDDAILCISQLKVRGAPLIGVFAAAAVAVSDEWTCSKTLAPLAQRLINARPTAVNLEYAVRQVQQAVQGGRDSKEDAAHLRSRAWQRALALLHCEIAANEQLGRIGAASIRQVASPSAGTSRPLALAHICNTGGLATPGLGTALGVVRTVHATAAKGVHAYLLETRPLLQGGRLSAWECVKDKIPHTIITDGMSGALLRSRTVDAIVVGADRIAANGDFANKIGTYTLAIVAAHHKVPLFAVAPLSTVDLACETGADIVIEERKEAEVRGYQDCQWAPSDSPTWNPAFDVTPIDLIAGIVTEVGFFSRDEIQETAGGLQTLLHKKEGKRPREEE
uniref:S-methyl-5-thioribose-1-phosphate isomerase n=1 Tax=Sexangularia sp. CB-2014 TaxID=1486929 RepID=A0A7S1VBF3_9EUKA